MAKQPDAFHVPQANNAVADHTNHAETQFKSLLEAAPDAIIIVYSAGAITIVNQQA